PNMILPEGDLEDVRAIIGGNKNQLLFIIYRPNNIGVYDSKLLNCICTQKIPFSEHVELTGGCCFVKIKNENININNLIMFYAGVGILIRYDENNYTFEFELLPIEDDFCNTKTYSCVLIKNILLVFGGFSGFTSLPKKIFAYSILQKRWEECLLQLS